jgi:Na+-translocating ferredoxin:NAD+ oxidoreductase subunit B
MHAYRRLAEHLDSLPGGFPPSTTGAELRLLATLFTPEQADLASRLTLEREDALAVASRLGLPLDETSSRLAEMAERGLIFRVRGTDGATLYQAAPWIVGIIEFQVNDLTPALLAAKAEYVAAPKASRPSLAPTPLRLDHGFGEVRTIPIGKAVDSRLPVLPYERVEEMMRAHTRYAVAPCICRRQATIRGEGCDAPEETCLMFDEWADFYADTGRGRSIDLAEVTAILERANAANLVLQPSNSRKAAFLCCCCGCCCAVLGRIMNYPRPADAVATSFVASYDASLCRGCETCVGRCQMGALTSADGEVAFDAGRCIGCGLCVSTCPTGALHLIRKPDAEAVPVPETLSATWSLLAEVQAGR